MLVGDIIRLKNIDFFKNKYIPGWVSPEMEKFTGKILIIRDLSGNGDLFYINQGEGFLFSKEWVAEILNKEG